MFIVSDLLVKDFKMSSCQKIVNKTNQTIYHKEVFHKKQDLNRLKTTKVIVLLDMLIFIKMSILEVVLESIKLIIDNKF